MRELVRRGLYVLTTLADEEADADDFSVFDVESAILTGKIVERQKESEMGEWKYVISGEAVDGRPLSGRREVWRFRPDAVYPYCICGITRSKLAAKTVAVLVFKFDL